MSYADSVIVNNRFGDDPGVYDRAEALHPMPAEAVEYVRSRYLPGNK
jgi:hypothetical protein